MRSYRRLLNNSYKDYVTNEPILRRIQATIGEYDELQTFVNKLKPMWFGHNLRSFGLAKTFLKGTKRMKKEEKGVRGRGWKTEFRSGHKWSLLALSAPNMIWWQKSEKKHTLIS